MKALQLIEPGKFAEMVLPLPELKDGQVLLKIKSIGICGTDYHAYNGNQPFFSYPRILGHELGAEVIAIKTGNGNSHIKVGDSVAVEPYLNCNNCQACKNGKFNCCENLKVIGVHVDGGMAEHIIMPVDKVHASSILNYEQLALVETLGIGFHACNRSELKTNDSVLIIGAGPIGLSIAQFASNAGAKVYLADFNIERLEFAKKHKLASETIALEASLSQDQLKGFCDGNLPTIIFDASGKKESMQNCFNLAPSGGKIVFVGLFIGDMSFNDPNFHKKELTVLSSRNSLPSDFKTIIALMEEGKVDTEPWISHRSSFPDFLSNFQLWRKPESKVIKAILNF